jgi:hypothetical protein
VSARLLRAAVQAIFTGFAGEREGRRLTPVAVDTRWKNLHAAWAGLPGSEAEAVYRETRRLWERKTRGCAFCGGSVPCLCTVGQT